MLPSRDRAGLGGCLPAMASRFRALAVAGLTCLLLSASCMLARLPLWTSFFAIIAEFLHWRGAKRRPRANSTDLTPNELRELVRDRMLRQILYVDAVKRMFYGVRVALLPSAHWSVRVWSGWVLMDIIAMWLWRLGWPRDRALSVWGWLYTVQVTFAPSRPCFDETSKKAIFLAWGAEGDGEAVTGSFIWGAGVVYPVVVALLGQPKLAWTMLVMQLVGVATAQRLVSPYLPSDLVHAETWAHPVLLTFWLLGVVTIHMASSQQVGQFLFIRALSCWHSIAVSSSWLVLWSCCGVFLYRIR